MKRAWTTFFLTAVILAACGGNQDVGTQSPADTTAVQTTPQAPAPPPVAPQIANTAPVPVGTEVPVTPTTPTPTSPTPPTASPTGAVPPGYRLVWSEEFDGTSLDTSKWSTLGYGMPEGVHPKALDIQGGLATFRIFQENGIYYTYIMGTDGLYSNLYGYIEARIKYEGESGSWCGFWSSTPTMGQPVGDTAVAGAEFDVIELRTHDNQMNYIGDHGVSTLNWDGWGGDPNKKTAMEAVWAPDGTPLNGYWHKYAVLWTDQGYTFYIDDQPTWQTSTALSKRTQPLRLTCQVRDWRFAGGVPAGGYGSLADTKVKMQVDYVRWWQK